MLVPDIAHGLPESRIGIGGILGITSLAALAAADDWNSGSGLRAVTVTDLERPECNQALPSPGRPRAQTG
ncbi:hypothetical protein [Streptomyces sp. NPDC002250]|uniref:hypothetical protein n=1 Tax=Streptomyces sp. NPDC002250 TaxID=3364641 RepID=UPI00369D6D03